MLLTNSFFKAVLGMGLLLFILFVYQFIKVSNINNNYSNKFLFDEIVNYQSSSSIYLVDGLKAISDETYIDYCELSKIYTLAEMKNVFSRYPKIKTLSNYYSREYNNGNKELADKALISYNDIAVTDYQSLKVKKCVN